MRRYSGWRRCLPSRRTVAITSRISSIRPQAKSPWRSSFHPLKASSSSLVSWLSRMICSAAAGMAAASSGPSMASTDELRTQPSTDGSPSRSRDADRFVDQRPPLVAGGHAVQPLGLAHQRTGPFGRVAGEPVDDVAQQLDGVGVGGRRRRQHAAERQPGAGQQVRTVATAGLLGGGAEQAPPGAERARPVVRLARGDEQLDARPVGLGMALEHVQGLVVVPGGVLERHLLGGAVRRGGGELDGAVEVVGPGRDAQVAGDGRRVGVDCRRAACRAPGGAAGSVAGAAAPGTALAGRGRVGSE